MDSYERRLVQLGLKIAYFRKLRGLTQEQLAEKANISAGYLSQVESRGMLQAVSLRTLFLIAAACGVEPSRLLEYDP